MSRVRDYLKKPFHLSRSTTPEPPPASADCPKSSDTSSVNSTHHPAWVGLKRFAAVLSASGDLFGPLKSAIDILVKFIEVSEAAAEAHEEYAALRTWLDRLFDDLAERFGESGESIPPGMRPSIMELARGIEREIVILKPKEQTHELGRYAGAVQDAEQVLKCYRRIQTLLERLALNANVNIWMLVDEQATCYRLDKLSPSHAALYCSAESRELYRGECTPDTRVEVLERFQVWRDDDESEKIYWLNGMAGTGKTTLAYTLCKQLENDSRLAANFFCSRQLPSCRDVNRILPTIAYQLAKFSYPFRYALSRVLELDPDVHTRRLSDQFTNLIFNPLCEVRHSISNDFVVIIEALDECDSPGGVGEILDTLFSHASDLPIRFFLTSRPEPEIRERMCVRSGDRERFELHLHDLDKSIVQGDIRKYLQLGLKRASISAEDLDILTERSGALFIYAATVVRHISAHNFLRSADRLDQVLHASTSSNDSDKDINALYTLILADAFDDPHTSGQEKNEMRLVLHTAICAQEPLNARIMGGILGLKREELVHAALNPLRSVLDIQKANEGITTLHKSFPDYMFDRARSGRFYCDAEKHHATLVERCLALIKIPSPPFNICQLESSYVLDKDVADLDEKIERHVSGELFYACRYWGTHLKLAGGSWDSLGDLHSFLSERLLLWMEVMNLKRCLQLNGVDMLAQMKKLVEHRGSVAGTRELAADAYEFVHAFSTSPASSSTPHIYVSALPFWQKERPVSKHYSNIIQSAVWPTRQALPRSQSLTLPIYSIGSGVRCVAFSHDGKRIAAGSDDTTVRIWDPLSGRVMGAPLEGHTGPVCCIAYSPDGKHVASGSTDKSIRVWDARTGQVTRVPIREHTGAVFSVAYGGFGSGILVSGSEDGTIRAWSDGLDQTINSPLRGFTKPIYCVAWSPECDDIAIGWRDGIWSTLSFHIDEQSQGHSGAIYSIAYSPDKSRIVSGSEDHSIRIWSAKTGDAIGKPLMGHTAAVCSLTYTPDGARIISGSADNTIRIWDASSGETVFGPLMGHHGPVHSVACSPNGDMIASGSADNTLRIWDAKTGRMMHEPLKWHTRASHSIVYSTEATSSPSFVDYDIQCSWDTNTGNLQFNPSLHNAVSRAIVITGPPAPDRAGTCYVQDQLVIPASREPPTQTICKDTLNYQDEVSNHPSLPGPSSSTAGDSICSTWGFDCEGWVVSNSSHRLFWVPQRVQDRIWHPQATGSIPKENALWLDLNAILVGEKWHRCYIAPAEREKGDPIAGGGREQETSDDSGSPLGSPGSPEKDNAAAEGGTHDMEQGLNFLIICLVMLVLSCTCAYILD